MKNSKIDLFNIDILTPNAKDVFGLGQVTDPNIFETNSKIFRKGGLYDPEIFGKPGTAERAETFGYIDLILPILHPLIYQTLTELGIVYNNIAEAKVYAKYDSRVGDFIVTDREHGETGYTFLLDNIHKVKFDSRGSDRRDIKVKLVKKYATKERYMTKLLVLPAGLRDYTEDKAGRPSEDEINNLYRKLLAVTTMIKNIDTKGNYALLNSVRLKIQKCVIEIYQYIKTLIDGKHKFIQGQFTKRAVSYGTRNVITPMENDVKDLTKTSTPKINTVTVGLYQYIKSVTPIAINRVLGMFVNSILNQSTTSAYLVDPKTMKTTLVEVSVKKRDEWLSVQGLTDIMNKLGQPEQRNLPVLIDKWYMFCVYDDGKTVIRLDHTDDLPEGLDRKHVRPITYAELFYLTVCDISSKYPAFVTRYPVVEVGGTYPCKVYLKTTVKGRTITYKYRQYEKEVREYPVIGGLYVESMSPHNTRLGRLGADFDGDSVNALVVAKKVYKKVQNKNYKTTSLVNYKTKEENNMSAKSKIRTEYGLIDLASFPKGKLIKKTERVEEYEVPEDIKVLAIWNGKKEWLNPTSYSIHKNIEINHVKTNRGNVIICSNDHSLVTVDKNLNYKRNAAVLGMCVPKYTQDITEYVDYNNIKRRVKDSNVIFNLNEAMGYTIGAIIGDGWVNYTVRPNDIIIATVHDGIVNYITETLREYGYDSKPYLKDNPHKFDNRDCFSRKATWSFRPLANILRENIGHLAENKHLPEWWVRTSKGFRWGLLSGLIDTDGTITKFVGYSTKSRLLAYEFIALCNSLGLTCGITIHQRKNKDTLEYYLFISRYDNGKLRTKLTLNNTKKLDALSKLPIPVSIRYTPNLVENKVLELRRLLWDKKETLWASRLSEGLRKSRRYKHDPYVCRDTMLTIFKTYPELLKDKYWKKLNTILEDKDIEWEPIVEIKPAPIDTAYDLTIPPMYTFVIQNGVIVYDTCSLNVLYTEDSVKEVDDFLGSKEAYLSPTGEILYSSANDISDLVMSTLTE